MLRFISTVLRPWTAGFVVTGFIFLLLILPRVSLAATNTANDTGGGSVNLGSSGPVTVNSVQLGLNKQARDLAGIVLPGGSNVTSGQDIYFVLYIDNSTDVSAGNIQITDLLNESQFTYIINSIETTVVPSGSSDAAIWAGVWSALTDAVGGPDDVASITDTGGPAGLDRLTVGAVAGQVNQTLDIPSGSLRAVRIRVTVN